MSRAAILLLLAGVLPLAGQTDTAPMNARERGNLDLVLTWWREVIEARHTELAAKYQPDDYIQHDPNVLTGRAAMIAYFEHVGKPLNPIPAKLSQPPIVQGAKGDFVWLIFEDPSSRANTFEIFRIQHGKVQEHWDCDERISGSPPFVPFHGPAPSTWDTGTRQTPGSVLTLRNDPYVVIMWENKNKEATWNSFTAYREGSNPRKWTCGFQPRSAGLSKPRSLTP